MPHPIRHSAQASLKTALCGPIAPCVRQLEEDVNKPNNGFRIRQSLATLTRVIFVLPGKALDPGCFGLIVRFGLVALSGPIGDLSGSYDAHFSLRPPSLEVITLLIAGSGLFGILGSWLVVNQHLKRINP